VALVLVVLAILARALLRRARAVSTTPQHSAGGA